MLRRVKMASNASMANLQAIQWGILLLKTYDPDPISNSASLPFICT